MVNTPGGAGGSVGPQFDVGSRLRQLRVERGMSQRELARRAEMTNANLSMIEQGRVSPSLLTLERILRAIPISLQAFFHPEDFGLPYLSKRSTQTRIVNEHFECITCLTPEIPGQPYLLEMHLKPGAAVREVPVGSPDSWLSGLVLSGVICLGLDGSRSELEPGDAFQIHLSRKFCLENSLSSPAILTAALTSARISRLEESMNNNR